MTMVCGPKLALPPDAVYPWLEEFRRLGHKNLQQAVDESIQVVQALAEPEGHYQLMPVGLRSNTVALSDDLAIPSGWLAGKLAGAQQVAVVVVSLGSELSVRVERTLQWDPLTGRVQQLVAQVALNRWSEQMWRSLGQTYAPNYNQLTPFLQPGSADFPRHIIPELLGLVPSASRSVRLGRSGELKPPLSALALVGLGQDVAWSIGGHNCDVCGYFDCFLRQFKYGSGSTWQ